MINENKASTENVLGYEVETRSVSDCINEIANWILRGKAIRWLSTINPHSYVLANKDSMFFSAMHDADWLVPDGIGIVLASKILGGDISKRVAGGDIFQALQKKLNEQKKKKVYFLGSSKKTLELISERMKRDYPNIRVVGAYSPPYKPEFTREENDAMIRAINKAKPHVLWVGMTAPKQEKWIYQNRKRLKVKFAAAIGAVFDFYAGNVKRSHPIFQKLGLEWLPRLIREPRRLWRRTFISAPIFMWHVFKARLKKRP